MAVRTLPLQERECRPHAEADRTLKQPECDTLNPEWKNSGGVYHRFHFWLPLPSALWCALFTQTTALLLGAKGNKCSAPFLPLLTGWWTIYLFLIPVKIMLSECAECNIRILLLIWTEAIVPEIDDVCSLLIPGD